MTRTATSVVAAEGERAARVRVGPGREDSAKADAAETVSKDAVMIVNPAQAVLARAAPGREVLGMDVPARVAHAATDVTGIVVMTVIGTIAVPARPARTHLLPV